MEAMDTQNSDAAATACGPIAVKLVRLGMMTTPPPIPHSELSIPATKPVGTATATGIALLSPRGLLLVLKAGRRRKRDGRRVATEQRAASILPPS
jgi:hypothetical protein